MKVNITGRKIDISAGIRSFTEKKLLKLDKFFDDAADAQVTLSVEKERQTAELTIYYGGFVYRAEDTSEDMYASIDRAIDLIERQIRKNKTRLEKKLRDGAFTAAPEMSDTEEKEFKIVKSKKHALKPMSPEEAILQMNLLGHEFFVFHNDETDKIDIVYKRKDGNYGLIEAEA
ncbi:MAG: ribosome-associated translation inhibitor RaiA [Clostridia bacterium]|nr:ribosome-associated translation inhibitor RaiA [Oscillospiraceae bacterium]MBQ7032843.1 ribosome-associated translation inhibitor RaiA [Clostridia bacterium]